MMRPGWRLRGMVIGGLLAACLPGAAVWAGEQAVAGCAVAVVHEPGNRVDRDALRDLRPSQDGGALSALRVQEVATPEGWAAALATAAGEAQEVIAIGGGGREVMASVAVAHPGVRFTLINSHEPAQPPAGWTTHDLRVEESGYLAGALAGLLTRRGQVGFIGGAATPSVRRYAMGFRAGVAATAPQAQVQERVIGHGPGAFRDPYTGYILVEDMANAGMDVLFAAAGASGLGALQAATDRGILSIGVESELLDLFPESMVAALPRHLDRVVLELARACALPGAPPPAPSLGVADKVLDLIMGPAASRLPSGARETLSGLLRRLGDRSLVVSLDGVSAIGGSGAAQADRPSGWRQ